MVALATVSVLSRRWRPPTLCSITLEQHPNIFQIVPKDLFDARIDSLDIFVRTSCPSIHLEYYVYVFTVACVVCSAAFSLAARSAGISMWYPLLLLLIPAGLNIWTNQRRSGLIDRIRSFERALKKTLKEFTKLDTAAHRIKWCVRRPNERDPLTPAERVGLFCLLIEVVDVDSEMEQESLPPYQAAVDFTNSNTMNGILVPSDCLPPSYTEITPLPSAVYQRPLPLVTPASSTSPIAPIPAQLYPRRHEPVALMQTPVASHNQY